MLGLRKLESWEKKFFVLLNNKVVISKRLNGSKVLDSITAEKVGILDKLILILCKTLGKLHLICVSNSHDWRKDKGYN